MDTSMRDKLYSYLKITQPREINLIVTSGCDHITYFQSGVTLRRNNNDVHIIIKNPLHILNQ